MALTLNKETKKPNQTKSYNIKCPFQIANNKRKTDSTAIKPQKCKKIKKKIKKRLSQQHAQFQRNRFNWHQTHKLKKDSQELQNNRQFELMKMKILH